MVTRWTEIAEPQVGDMALHKSNQLDAREVVRVEKLDGKLWIGLKIGEIEAWPCPAKNYIYTRRPA